MAANTLTLLLVFASLTSNSAKLRGLDAKAAGRQEAGDGPSQDHYDLDKVVMRRGSEELAIAKNANKQAATAAKDAKAGRENLLAMQAIGLVEDNYAKIEPLVTEAREQLLTVRKFEAEAEQHAKHAKEVLFESRYVPEAAAEKAIEATSGWIKQEATASAEASAKGDNRQERLIAAVAASAEPYHLALLRNQKFCEETYAKAKSAQGSASKLLSDAKKVALKAQELQAVGQGVEARQTWGMASGMSSQAELLRQWGLKLYDQANTACGSSGGYELLEQQAAANVAATMIMNAPPKLPPK